MNEPLILNGHQPVPDSRDLRLAADWSSAARNQSLRFAMSNGRLSLTANGETAFFACRTEPYATRPKVLKVEVTVGHAAPLCIDAGECSALVWGESAVEKFLFPYYASAAGRDAAALLTDVSAVWYDYPHTVEVCALAYGFGSNPAPGNLSLRDTVGVVFLDRGMSTVRRLTLDEFLEQIGVSPRRTSRVHEDAGPGVGFDEPLTAQMASVVLRDAAEYVSGVRPHRVRFTQDGWLLVPTLEGPGRGEESRHPAAAQQTPWFSEPLENPRIRATQSALRAAAGPSGPRVRIQPATRLRRPGSGSTGRWTSSPRRSSPDSARCSGSVSR